MPIDSYRTQIDTLVGYLGSRRAVARLLGIAHQTLNARLEGRGTVRNEQLLAAEKLIERIRR